MTADLGLRAGRLAGTVPPATLPAWRAGDERRDRALSGGSGLAPAATSAASLVG